MKKHQFCAFLLAIMICIPHMPVQAAENHRCGDSITWNYDEITKLLELDGSGEMYHYEDYLGNKAPWAYYDIEQVSISEGITSIGDYAFYGCVKLSDLSLPESITQIGEAAFMGTGLESVSLDVKEIGDNAFNNCQRLRSVTLRSGAERIGDGCFAGDYLLSSLEVPDTVNHIGYDAFNACAAWYQAQTEDFVILGDGILCKYFGSETEIIVPDTVKQICAKTFISPIYLFLPGGETTSFDAPNASISKIHIPDSVSVIEDTVFRDLTGLQDVELPAHLKEIGNEAFYGCTSLKTIDIPNTVQHIGSNAFYGNPWLSDAGDYVILGEGLLYKFQGRQKILNVPEQVKTILTGAFSGDKILEIWLSDCVEKIEPKSVSCKNAVIISEPNGAAAQYAAAENIPFRSVYEDITPQGENMKIDYNTDGWYFGNSGKFFGGDYYLKDADRQRLIDLDVDTHSDKEWAGSCVGLAITVILVKNGVFNPSQLEAGTETLSEVEPTKDIVSFINYYQCLQGRGDMVITYEPEHLKFQRMLKIAKNISHGESPFLLTFATKSSSHGVVGYGLESGSWEYNDKTYDGRILVWDSNFPKELHDGSCLYYDSKTFDYCIPYYDVHVADGAEDNTAGIITVCNDISILNAYPYSFSAEGIRGDVNCDQSITVADAVMLARVCAEDSNVSVTETGMENADVNEDGFITVFDVTQILKILAST